MNTLLIFPIERANKLYLLHIDHLYQFINDIGHGFDYLWENITKMKQQMCHSTNTIHVTAITTRMITATAIVTPTSMVAAIVIVSTIVVMIILAILTSYSYSCHVCLQKTKNNQQCDILSINIRQGCETKQS